MYSQRVCIIMFTHFFADSMGLSNTRVIRVVYIQNLTTKQHALVGSLCISSKTNAR